MGKRTEIRAYSAITGEVTFSHEVTVPSIYLVRRFYVNAIQYCIDDTYLLYPFFPFFYFFIHFHCIGFDGDNNSRWKCDISARNSNETNCCSFESSSVCY